MTVCVCVHVIMCEFERVCLCVRVCASITDLPPLASRASLSSETIPANVGPVPWVRSSSSTP